MNRYKNSLIYIGIALLLWGGVAVFSVPKALLMGSITYDTFLRVIKIMIAVFIIIGLIKVWVHPKHLSRFLGKEAGFKGLLFASTFPIILGGSLFTMFPLLRILREKGASIAAILSFITAWGGKAPLLPLEISFLGVQFAVLRIAVIIPSALLIGIFGEFLIEKWERNSFSPAREN
ncbi:MAG: permease [Spirochaetia bacterium]|nr:permease [Spirochaetia bacterium]